MTKPKDQESYELILGRIEAKLEAMQPAPRNFAKLYRRHIELSGRTGPCGCAAPELEEFLINLQAVLDDSWERFSAQGKKFDTRSEGSGV